MVCGDMTRDAPGRVAKPLSGTMRFPGFRTDAHNVPFRAIFRGFPGVGGKRFRHGWSARPMRTLRKFLNTIDTRCVKAMYGEAIQTPDGMGKRCRKVEEGEHKLS